MVGHSVRFGIVATESWLVMLHLDELAGKTLKISDPYEITGCIPQKQASPNVPPDAALIHLSASDRERYRRLRDTPEPTAVGDTEPEKDELNRELYEAMAHFLGCAIMDTVARGVDYDLKKFNEFLSSDLSPTQEKPKSGENPDGGVGDGKQGGGGNGPSPPGRGDSNRKHGPTPRPPQNPPGPSSAAPSASRTASQLQSTQVGRKRRRGDSVFTGAHKMNGFKMNSRSSEAVVSLASQVSC